jgi:hypothetical protein
LIILNSNAVIEPRAVMIELFNTSITLLAVLRMLKDMSLANIAKILINIDIKVDNIIAFELCLSF